MARDISEKRKTAYYFGMAVTVIGALMFASTFVLFAVNFGNFDNFENDVKTTMFLALGGMALMVVGGIIMNMGARGLAGSGVVLDPERARGELEPYSRMTGGMLKDALDEADIKIGSGSREKVIMVKCRACGKLNEEDSKFCQQCGKPV